MNPSADRAGGASAAGPGGAAGPRGAGGPGGAGGAGGSGPAYLVRGDDPALVDQAVHALVGELAGVDDPSLVVEEHGGPASDAVDLDAVVDALTTPPFLLARRVVVVRDAGRLAASDAARLTAWVADPTDGVSLVLVAGGGTVPQALVKAVRSAGTVVETSAGRGRARTQWLEDHVRRSEVRLDARALARLDDHLGGDVGRLAGILDTLAAAYGRRAVVTVDELEPYLGEAGSVPPWELTDAVDAGEAHQALAVLHRMLDAGGVHPLAVLATLHRHVRQLLALDGSGVTTPEEAASLLGLSSPYPAKKALAQSRRLGRRRIGQAVELVARADLDLRGGTALPGSLVLEVLVARLARLSPRRGR